MTESLLPILSPDDFRRIRELFERTLELPPTARPGFLDDTCVNEPSIRAEVERMLEADMATAAVLDRAVVPAASDHCVSCRGPLAPADHFCRVCGTPVGGSSGEEGRFRAGTLFARRFRIVARLGRGGMGEVYRADDLELGQRVALKFLTSVRVDQRARERLRNEVRLARQITHPNICRVYDIGEAEGELYLSMEYVDGEDLSALLKRIGRLPIDKGMEIGRKLCAGLAAAHARGVLHRDFKPANIMIDGHGEVRIMDFGLAALAARIESADVRSGTPAYMAPEQLSGREATVQSDIYALGLVLFELFTGKAAFDARDASALQRQRQSTPATTPSTLVPELSPRLERTILRCLEAEPKLRSTSALEVLASLPGGDPLMEALAAGETPSPGVVAAAGSKEALRPRVAYGLLACVVVGLAAVLVLSSYTQLLNFIDLPNNPETLLVHAEDAVRDLGYPAGNDLAFGLIADSAQLRQAGERITSEGLSRIADWTSALARKPSPMLLWRRESPEPMRPTDDPIAPILADDPSLSQPGTTLTMFDANGSLRRFTAVANPLQSNETRGMVDWPVAFRHAHLEASQFTRIDVEPSAERPHDEHVAWSGRYPGTETRIRIVGEAYRGRITHFEVLFPTSEEALASPSASSSHPTKGLDIIAFLANVLPFVGFAWGAKRNIRTGRADLPGAWRIAEVGWVTNVLGWLLAGDHTTLSRSMVEFSQRALIDAPSIALPMGLAYLALEPLVRRHRPETIITWSRWLMGRWRDPVVTRDILIGLASATLGMVLLLATNFGTFWVGGTPAINYRVLGILGRDAGPVAALILSIGWLAWLLTATIFFLWLVLRTLIRWRWLAWSVLIVVMAVVGNRTMPNATIAVNEMGLWLMILILLYLSERFGLLAAVCYVTFALAETLVFTPHVTTWYGRTSLIGLVLLPALAFWLCRLSLVERRFSAPANLAD